MPERAEDPAPCGRADTRPWPAGRRRAGPVRGTTSDEGHLRAAATPYSRVRLGAVLGGRHAIFGSYAPLRIESRGALRKDVVFEGVAFPAGGRGDALAASQGRAEDASLALEARLREGVHAWAGYRILEGGSDGVSVFNFALVHFVGAGLTVRL
jgi:hypothetical protein